MTTSNQISESDRMLILVSIARLRASVMAVVFGLTGGTGLWVATAWLLIRGGERVGLSGLRLPPRRGEAQLMQMAQLLSQDDDTDYGSPQSQGMLPHSRALFISDFLGDLKPIENICVGHDASGIAG